MTESDGMAFAAIITITLPDSYEATELNVTLWPSNLVNRGKGTAKPLQDCTLGELLQFADSLENEIWSTYRESNLLDLVIEGGAEIDFMVNMEDVQEVVVEEFWLEHLIVVETNQSSVTKLDGTQGTKDDPLVTNKSEENPDAFVEFLDETSVEEPGEMPETSLTEQAPGSDIEATGGATGAETVVDRPEVDSASADEVDEDHMVSKVATKNGKVVEKLAEPEITVAEPGPILVEKELEETKPTEIEDRPLLRILGRRRPLNHPTWTSVDILINESTFRNTQAHALSSLDREVAGVLVGPPPEKQPDGRHLVHISDTIIAKYTRMHGASVTYTPESWRYINDTLADKYPDNEAVIIGWYHTHPGFGIFLSGMDQFIHQNFFTQIWHIALVLDPLAKRSGFFCWDRQLSKVDRYGFPWPDWAKNSW
jgi:proteasome lid subunit RPN8/RPN11